MPGLWRLLVALGVGAACCVPAAAQDAEVKAALQPARRATLERSLVAELSIRREDRGLPPLEWDPRLALTLREYLADMLARGWTGGPPIATPAGKATVRAKQRHRHTAPEVFDNFSPQTRENFSVETVAEALISAELMASFRTAENRLAAAAIVEGDGGVFSCIAVVNRDPAQQATRSGRSGAAWLAVLGSRGAARAVALKTHLPGSSAAAVPWLTHLLQTDRDAALRAEAARALGRTGTTTAVAPLIALLLKSKAEVKTAAAEALGTLTGQTHGEDGTAWARWWESANEAFTLPAEESTAPAPSEGGPTEAPLPDVPPVDGKAALAGFKNAMKSKDPALRVIACEGLGYAKPPRAAATLAKLLGDPDDEVRRAAARAMGALGEPAGLARLQKAWGGLTGKPRLARAAVDAVGGIQDTKAVSFLVDLLPTLQSRHGTGVSNTGFTALRRLTGHDAGASAGDWKAWWKGAKREFTFPAPPEPDGK